MKNRRNYYRVLNVQPDVSFEVIQSSYRSLMRARRMHPDLGGDHWNAAVINEAYATLRDPQKRAAYDKTLSDLRQRTAQPPPAKPSAAKTAPAGVCAFCLRACDSERAGRPGAVCAGCGSPLTPAVRSEAGTATRRSLDRLPRRIRVTCIEPSRPGLIMEMTTENVSINGMLLNSSRPLGVGLRLKIQCDICHAVGVVTHAKIDSLSGTPAWRVGVQFLTLHLKKDRSVFLSLQG